MITRFRQFILGLTSWSVGVILVILLAACNSQDTVQPTANPKTEASLTTPIVVATETTQPMLEAHPAIGKSVLERDIKQATYIVMARVEQIGNLVWTTPDGNQPADIMDKRYSTRPEQLAPVQFAIVTSYKGNLQPGQTLTVYLSGAPGSQPYGTSKEFPDDFPKIGETRLWFFNQEKDLRQNSGDNPLISPTPILYYSSKPDNRWYAPNGNILTINELEAAIKNPSSEAASVTKPTITPEVQPGQNLNLVKRYKLDQAQSIVLKSAAKNTQITDTNTLKAIISTLDKSSTALTGPSDPPAVVASDMVLLAFVLPDSKTINFNYNLKDNLLTLIDAVSPVKVAAPDGLAQILGVK
jgi:uncharacterized lipoprotein YbaY